MSEEINRKYYQPTVETYKYNWWRGKWVQDKLYPSTLIFPDWLKAEMYKHKFIEGLKRRKVKLKEGNYKIFNAELYIPEPL